MEDARTPRARREIYRGHGKRDIGDVYERYEVASYLREDAQAMRTLYLAQKRANPVLLRNPTPSVFNQRHIGRVLRSSCSVRGRRLASSRGREPRPGRCPPLWPGDLRNDGGSVPAAGADGSEA